MKAFDLRRLMTANELRQLYHILMERGLRLHEAIPEDEHEVEVPAQTTDEDSGSADDTKYAGIAMLNN